MSGYVYILISETTGKYYTGSTNNLDRRIHQHNHGINKSTRKRGPWILVFSQKYESLSIARQIEFMIKKLKSKKIIDNIIKDGYIRLNSVC